MKKLFIILCLCTAVLLVNISYQAENTVIIYSCLEQFRNEELQKQLDEKFPGSNILIMYISTAKAATKIKVEGSQADADILIAVETSYMDMVRDSLADLDNDVKLSYLDGLTLADNENKYVIWERFAGAFIINENVIKKYNLPIPEIYQDLLKPEYRNLIAMPDPKTSGTGYFFYKSLVNELGEKEALEYFDQLHANIKSFTESGSGPIKLLLQGEVAIGMGMTFQAVTEINKGAPFKIIYPPEGSPYSLSGTGIVKGHENKPMVKEVYKYITNDFLLYDKKYFSPELILQGQTIEMDNYPENIKYANMQGIKDITEKERLLKAWKY